MKYNKINNLLGWLCGIIAFVVYFLTTEKTSSWWDTGEFIASAYKLEIVHQPGAPLFLMIQNIFSNLAFGDPSKIAFWMNIGSVLCSALCIVFLFWTITAIARKLLLAGGEANHTQQIQIFGAGMLGALAYSFSDSFWYSAIESEVYAMSSLCTALVFWLALKWERRADEPDSNKWLLVLAYVMGLSIGVHLLNLLTIPAIALLIYFRKSSRVSWKGIVKSLGWGILALAFVLWGVIQYSVRIAAQFDLFFVNGMGMPFGTGIIAFILLLAAGLIFGIYYSIKKSKPILHLTFLSICFIYLGFGSYSLLVVRSQTNISLNNNSPDNVFSFLGYLSREQYQSEPLLKGPNFNSEIIGVKEGSGYRKDENKYSKVSGRNSYEYSKEVLFPRVYSDRHADFYRQYLGLAEGESPSFVDNMKFFFNYQVGHMYTRYFLWNFVGRQNDTPSQGELTSGNWISGISFLDELRIPGEGNLTSFLKDDPSRNTYFFIPLLLGLMGLTWQIKKSKKDAAIVGLLFFFTGLAIVLYLNQSPLQPRERDYAYSGSFYVFAIWIGLGVLALQEFLQKRVRISAKRLALVSSGAMMIAGPLLLITQNWDDHDRSQRSMSRDVAWNTLNSCEPNAILITYGDNDTFPLWYLQEVEGVRTDVRIINYGYLQSEWYVKQAMQDINQAKALPISFGYDKVQKGVRDIIRVVDMGIEGHVDLEKMMAVMLSDDASNKVQFQQGGDLENILPSKKLQLKVNKDAVLKHAVVPKAWEAYVPEYMQWDFPQNYVSRSELTLMSVLTENNWERPIYFTKMSPNSIFMGMDKYLASEGLVLKLMPIEIGQPSDNPSLVNSERIYANAMQTYQWPDINSLNHFDTDTNTYYEHWIYSNVYEQGIAQLMQQNKRKEARDLALKAYDFQPKDIRSIRLSYLNSTVVDTLYKTKETQKAQFMMQKNLQGLDELLNRQLQISSRGLGGSDNYSIQLGLATLERYRHIVEEAKDESLLAQVSGIEQKYRAAWM